jgi:predicted  nucleic acid-binding Zn-ribbon protein
MALAVPQVLGAFLQRLEDERRRDLDAARAREDDFRHDSYPTVTRLDAARAREDDLTRQLLDARERIGRLEGELSAVRTQTQTGEVSPRPSFWQRLRGRA